MLPRPCASCGVPQTNGAQCAAHTDASHGRRGRARAGRGYGAGYGRAREALRAAVADRLALNLLVACSLCGQPLTSLDDFSADHLTPLSSRQPRDQAGEILGAAHKRCQHRQGGQLARAAELARRAADR